MKRQLFAVLVCMTMFAVTSCGEKKGKDKFEERIEKAKESVEDVMDDAKDQIEDKADEVGETTLSTILCKWKQDSVVSSSYIWILFSNISINWFIINPQL